MFYDCGFILTKNSDITLTSYKTAMSYWLKFKINQPATVYVVLQASHGSPSWLSDWTLSSGNSFSSDISILTTAYYKHFNAGDVIIGSFSVLSANYSVIVKPDKMPPETVEIIRKYN